MSGDKKLESLLGRFIDDERDGEELVRADLEGFGVDVQAEKQKFRAFLDGLDEARDRDKHVEERERELTMAYETDKDKVIKDLGKIGDSDLFAQVRSYDGATPKLEIYRMIGKNKDKRKQVCRIALADVQVLGPYFKAFDPTELFDLDARIG